MTNKSCNQKTPHLPSNKAYQIFSVQDYIQQDIVQKTFPFRKVEGNHSHASTNWALKNPWLSNHVFGGGWLMSEFFVLFTILIIKMSNEPFL